MKLALHVVDEDGMINLDGVVEPGEHFTAQRNDNTGVVRLTPVEVNTTTKTKAPASDDDTIRVSFGGDNEHEQD